MYASTVPVVHTVPCTTGCAVPRWTLWICWPSYRVRPLNRGPKTRPRGRHLISLRAEENASDAQALVPWVLVYSFNGIQGLLPPRPPRRPPKKQLVAARSEFRTPTVIIIITTN